MNINKLTYAAALVSLAFCGIACSDDDYKTVDPNAGTPLALTASDSTFVLDEKLADSDALTLDWTTGTNYGTGNAITYKIEIAKATGDYSDGYSEELGRKVYSYSFSYKELNDFVRTNFDAKDNAAATYKAKVTAYVAEYDEYTQESEVEFDVTPYKPVSTTLYMIGGAAPAGWSADNAEAMTRTSAGIFTWTGTLNAGELKFITTLGQFWPAYVRDGSDASNGKIRYFENEPDNSLDLKFNVEAAGGYKVDVDLLNLTFSIEEADVTEPPYDQIYFVGNMTGWGFIKMNQDSSNPFVFKYGAEFTVGGEFKFATADGSWENMYKATEENAALTSTGVEFVSGYSPDNKWYMKDEEVGKAYKIALDITPNKETMTCTEFTAFESLWLIGDAAPHGWSLDDAASDDKCQLKPGEDKYVLTWTGTLSTGELKISCDLQRDWSGCWFMPGTANKAFEPVENGDITFVDSSKQSGVDRKWAIETAGSYTITVDQLQETITIVKN